MSFEFPFFTPKPEEETPSEKKELKPLNAQKWNHEHVNPEVEKKIQTEINSTNWEDKGV